MSTPGKFACNDHRLCATEHTHFSRWCPYLRSWRVPCSPGARRGRRRRPWSCIPLGEPSRSSPLDTEKRNGSSLFELEVTNATGCTQCDAFCARDLLLAYACGSRRQDNVAAPFLPTVILPVNSVALYACRRTSRPWTYSAHLMSGWMVGTPWPKKRCYHWCTFLRMCVCCKTCPTTDFPKLPSQRSAPWSYSCNYRDHKHQLGIVQQSLRHWRCTYKTAPLFPLTVQYCSMSACYWWCISQWIETSCIIGQETTKDSHVRSLRLPPYPPTCCSRSNRVAWNSSLEFSLKNELQSVQSLVNAN